MSYRISSTEKWKDMWFLDLSPQAKLLFFFFIENCDNAGFFEVNKKFMLFSTGLSEDDFYKAGTELKKSYIKSKDGSKLWFRNYLKYQKKLPLNPLNGSHKQIINILYDNLLDDNKFKGNTIIDSLLPLDYQTIKPQKNQKQTNGKFSKKDNEIVQDSMLSTEVKKPRPRFVKPTEKDVYDYMIEKEFEFAKIESQAFFNYFESNGWKVGSNSMADWKRAVANWILRYYKTNRIVTPKISKLQNIIESHEETEQTDWNEVYKKQ